MSENIDNKIPILLKDLGMRFPTLKSMRSYRYGLYQCQYCGKEFETQITQVTNGYTKSCGCLKGKNITHGLRGHRLYQTWSGMIKRCINIKNKDYIHYGGRGIKVCDRWLDIANFIEDMYPSYREGLSLDRIDVNGNYEPENCRWSSSTTQRQNTRDIICRNTSGYRGVVYKKSDNKWEASIQVSNVSTYLGIFKTALEAAKAYERYVRLNNLEHNFTPALTPEEIEEINKQKEKI